VTIPIEQFKERVDRLALDQEERRVEEAALDALEDIARQETVDLTHVPTEALKQELKRRGESVT